MRYLLDTNVVSDSRRPSAIALASWYSQQPLAELAISAITLLEINVGVLRKERRDPAAGARLRVWLEDVVRPTFADRTLPVDELVAWEASRLQAFDPMPAMDALIAATALSHGLTLVTRNTHDMARSRVSVLNPWQL